MKKLLYFIMGAKSVCTMAWLLFILAAPTAAAQNPEKETPPAPPEKEVSAKSLPAEVQQASQSAATMSTMSSEATIPGIDFSSRSEFNQVQTNPNLYTGTLGVQIPIYTIKTKGLELPIALNYNGSGLQYKDKESVVGAGWSLSCNWKITRMVKGIPDEKREYRESHLGYDYNESSDLFQYSIPGNSGMFTFHNDSFYGYPDNSLWVNWNAVFLMPYRDLEIEWDGYSNFRIIDANGLTYIFGAYEYVIQDLYQSVNEVEYIDVWYLTEIVDRTGEVLVKFKYEKQEYERKENFHTELYDIYYCFDKLIDHHLGIDLWVREDRIGYEIYDSERVNVRYDDTCSWEFLSMDPNRTYRLEYYKLKKYKLLLKDISWNEGSVSFSNTRITTEIDRSEKLSGIEVHSLKGKDESILVKKLKFIHDYFPSAEGQGLLKLDAIFNIDVIDGAPVTLYKFNYDQQIPPPLEPTVWSHSLLPHGDIFRNRQTRQTSDANILKSIELKQTGGTVSFEYYEDDYYSLIIKSITRNDGSNKMTTRYEYSGKQNYEGHQSYQIIGDTKYNKYYSKVVKINYNNPQIRDMNGVTVGYSQVREIHPNNSCTVYKFTNFSDHPDIIPPVYRYIGWGDIWRGPEIPTTIQLYNGNEEFLPKVSFAHRRGLLTEMANYDAGGKLTSIIKNSYDFKPITASNFFLEFEVGREIINDGVAKISIMYDDGRNVYTIKTQRFHISEPVRLASTVTEDRNMPKTTTTYKYIDRSMLVEEINTSIDNGDTYKTVIKYPGSEWRTVNAENPSSPFIGVYAPMDTPIEKLYYKNNSIIGGELNLFNKVKSSTANSRIVSYSQGSLKLDGEIKNGDGFFITGLYASGSPNYIYDLVYDPRYEFENFVESYDLYGNPTWITSSTGESKTIIYGYNNSLPIAEIENARPDQVFHTSFEEDGVVSGLAKTGDKVKNGVYMLDLSTLRNGNYILSYFKRTAAESVFARVVTTITVTDAEKSFTIGGAGIILDEVRVVPAGALMKTYTYKPLVGKSSETDANGVTVYCEYDGFGRPSAVRDNERNLLESVTYN